MHYGWTDGPTDERTDERTKPLIELLFATNNIMIVILVFGIRVKAESKMRKLQERLLRLMRRHVDRISGVWIMS